MIEKENIMENTILLIEDEKKTGEMLKQAFGIRRNCCYLAQDGKTSLKETEKGIDLINLGS